MRIENCLSVTWRISNSTTNDMELLSVNRVTIGVIRVDVDVFNLAIASAQMKKSRYRGIVIATSLAI